MAKGYLEKLMKLRGIRHVQVSTAGVMTRNGLLPTQESVQMLNEEGEDIRSHRSKPMTSEMLENADLVLGMGAFQVQKATRTNPNAKGKTFLLKEYVGLTGRNAQISDPMGGTMEVYRKVFSELKAAINLLVEKELFTNPPPELLALAQPPKPTKPARLTGPEGAADTPAPAKAKSEKPKSE
jgi:protein-tyrosine phosphatase